MGNFLYLNDKEKRIFTSIIFLICRLRLVKATDIIKIAALLEDDSFRGVFTISDFTASYYNTMSGKEHRDLIVTCSEPITSNLLTFYLRKDSYLQENINKYILNCASNGLLTKWTNEYIDKRYINVPQLKIPQVMTLDQVLGIFYICFCLHAIALIVFLLELFSPKFKCFRKFFNVIE